MTTDQPVSAGEHPDLEAAFDAVRSQFDTVPTFLQYEELERLATRIEIVMHLAERDGACRDTLTGKLVDPAVADKLLDLADPRTWQLDAAQLHQASVVADIPAHATWRMLTVAQRRALAAWRLVHPELTYGNVLRLGRETARQRLDLALALRARGEAPEPVTVTVTRRAPAPEPVQEILQPVAVRQAPEDPGAPEDPVTLEDPVDADFLAVPKRRKSAKETEDGRPAGGPGGAGKTDEADEADDVPTPAINRPAHAQAPDAVYAQAEGIDIATLEMVASEGIKPPHGARGFVRCDPYGLDTSLKEAVVSYFDKVELRIPNGRIPVISDRVADFNGFDLRYNDELKVGQYVWFPARTVLETWISDLDKD